MTSRTTRILELARRGRTKNGLPLLEIHVPLCVKPGQGAKRPSQDRSLQWQVGVLGSNVMGFGISVFCKLGAGLQKCLNFVKSGICHVMMSCSSVRSQGAYHEGIRGRGEEKTDFHLVRGGQVLLQVRLQKSLRMSQGWTQLRPSMRLCLVPMFQQRNPTWISTTVFPNTQH